MSPGFMYEHVQISLPYLRQIYSNVKSLLAILNVEVSPIHRAVIHNKLRLSNQKNSFEYLLNEGKLYLDLMENLHKHNQRISTMFTYILKTMDIYSRFKMQLRDKTIEDGLMRNFMSLCGANLFRGDHMFAVYEYKDFERLCRNLDLEMLLPLRLTEQLEANKIMELSNYIYHNYMEYHRDFILTNIESIIMKIKILCNAFTNNNVVLYHVLNHMINDYCKKVRMFMSDCTVKSSNPQDNRQKLRDAHEFSLLEELMERITEEQKYFARYVCISCKKENGKANN